METNIMRASLTSTSTSVVVGLGPTTAPLSPSSSRYPTSSSGFLKSKLVAPRNPLKLACGSSGNNHRFQVRAVKDQTKDIPSPEEVTNKYGLEAGLWKIFSSKDEEGVKEKSKGDQAKELLAKYGGAYLATSITLSLISFSLCYALISAGVDVSSLLQKLGIATNETGEKVGTFALAYAAHKAASPIRFPPTVALTPIVASWIGKKVQQ